ncbi:MAG: VOC family protein [Candidatus Nanopelagicales bacterium]
MPSRLNPYISFDGNARAAMEFYRDVFGGDLVVNTYGDFGQAGTPVENLIMHGMLESPSGFTLMGADSPPGMDRHPGSAITISLSGDDEAELRGYWDKLSDQGEVSVPLERQMWGDLFGQCTDRFGINWMVNIATPAE